jgi:hypothetical protein
VSLLGFLDDLPSETQHHFEQRLQRAEGEFDRKLQRAARLGKNILGIDFSSPWEREATLVPKQKQAALEYLEDLLFFVLDAYASVTLNGQELLDRINNYLAAFRQITLDQKWPKSMFPAVDGGRQQEREFDQELIHSLEGRKEWKTYEAQLWPEIAVPKNAEINGKTLNPLSYVDRWPLESLPTSARERIKAELLELHGNVLDRNVDDEMECWRRTYDLIAEAYAGSGLLADDLLKYRIPEMVADAAVGGGWSDEPFGRTIPTGIFSVHFGSAFYPQWRLTSFIQALQGRKSHWSGLLQLEHPVGSLTPQERTPTEKAPRALKIHRRKIVKAFREKNGFDRMDTLARRLGVSLTALQGMIRGDTTRYSDDKLDSVLKQFGSSRAEWDCAVDSSPRE